MNGHLSLVISLPKMETCASPDHSPPQNSFTSKDSDLKRSQPITPSFKLKKLKYLPKKDFLHKKNKVQRCSGHLMLPVIQNKNENEMELSGNCSERT